MSKQTNAREKRLLTHMVKNRIEERFKLQKLMNRLQNKERTFQVKEAK